MDQRADQQTELQTELQSEPFWKMKALEEMTGEEWESLCDGCGICCLEKLEDKSSGKITITSVSCPFLDIESCKCSIYNVRFSLNPECTALSPGDIKKMTWLPDSCAYRCIAEGRGLESWHPLLSGNPETVHEAGISLKGRAISGRYVAAKDLLGHVVY